MRWLLSIQSVWSLCIERWVCSHTISKLCTINVKSTVRYSCLNCKSELRVQLKLSLVYSYWSSTSNNPIGILYHLFLLKLSDQFSYMSFLLNIPTDVINGIFFSELSLGDSHKTITLGGQFGLILSFVYNGENWKRITTKINLNGFLK